MENRAFVKTGGQFSAGGIVAAACAVVFLLCAPAVRGAGSQRLHGQVPAAVANLRPMGHLARTNHLNLAIGLPLRNQEALTNLLRQIYDPASPNYRHYLTPEQFTEQFGPTEKDYQAVIAYAEANGFKVTGTHPNRTILDVQGSLDVIEESFHVTMRTYHHLTEARTFYAPDLEPSLDLAVPVLGISGLDNYVLPRPLLHKISSPNRTTNQAQPAAGPGSGPYGGYMGNDFRAAYVPGVTLTGAGQAVGLLEIGCGFYQNDISAYENSCRQPNVPVRAVLLDGSGGEPGIFGNDEVSLDIELAIAMAPGLSEVLVYEGYIPDDILNRMATDNVAKQISASWLYSVDPMTPQIFLEFAAQGQSYFNSSGDDDAYLEGAIPTSAADPYVTVVGGTMLTTAGPGGAWVSETTWNFGDGYGSGGGFSFGYLIPSYQTNIDMTANQGSTTQRNIPDVAMPADNCYILFGNGGGGMYGGTSCAAPLWAGFTALVNQRAAAAGKPPVGFINPAIYAIGSGPDYTNCFHDITTGNNTNSLCPTNYYAVPGYDLCTGWGTPNGQKLIDALTIPDALQITPAANLGALRFVGGPFSLTNGTFSLTNTGTSSLDWSLTNTALWLDASPGGGTLAAGETTNVTMSLNSNAYSLASGIYAATVWFNNLNQSNEQSRQFSLTVINPPEPANQTVMAGGTATFSVTVPGTGPVSYQWQLNGTNSPNGMIIKTVAGNGTIGYSGDYDVATDARLNWPSGVAVDASGNLFIVDLGNNRIRKVDTNGLITTVAGNGTYTYSGDGGAATLAGLNEPRGVAVDASGNLFIADIGDNHIRKVDPNGIITTVAGNGKYGHSGDGGVATNASLSTPFDVAVDASGNLFIADIGNNVIRKVDSNGIIATVAGNGNPGNSGDYGAATNASLNQPSGVAVDAFGNLFIADRGNGVIRKVDPNGIITTVAGNGTNGYSGDGGTATNARLNWPSGVGVDASGNLFIADMSNNRIRKVDPNGIITTVAGNGNSGFFGDGGVATSAKLNGPSGVALDAFGNLFIADSDNNRIREVFFNPTLTLSNVSTNDAGNYTVVITSSYGSVTSSVASLTVVLPSEPASQMVMAGGTATFSVAAHGAGPFTYQWQLNGTNLPDGLITTVAGNGTNGYFGDGGAATNANFDWPFGLTVDTSGNLFVADTDNAVIRKVDTNGLITTVAGLYNNGYPAYSGDGGPAINASMFWPYDVAVDASGNLFIADTGNALIRKVDTNGIITAVVGIFNGGVGGYSGDGGAATNASLYWPSGVAVDASGNLFIADTGNSVIRKVDPNGIITTVAGNGRLAYSGDGGAATNASLNQPSGVAVDVSGNLFIADTFNNVIRKVDTNGTITTVAGNGTIGYSGDGGAATNASLYWPSDIAVDAFGNLFIADTYNNVIRKVGPNGIITTVAGGGVDNPGDGDAATKASLNWPSGVAVNAFGDLFIADRLNNRIREVVQFASDPTLTLNNVTPNNAGNYTVVITSPSGSVTSSVASLTVVLPLEPANQTVMAGGTATFSVSISSTLPLSFQWQKDGINLTESGNISGLTTTNLVLTNIGANAAGNYTVVITSLYGSITSSIVTLTVVSPIVSQPQSLVVTNGNRASFSVSVSGTLPLSFQWQKDGTNLTEGGNISGSTTTNLVLTGVSATDAGNYTVVITGSYGSETSSVASLTVVLPPEPANQTVMVGGTATFSVPVPGAGPFTYQWQLNGTNLSNGMIITTAAGNGTNGYSGDNDAATNASLNWPSGVAVDASGNVFIADAINNRIRKVDTNGLITTVAGNGTYGYSGDGGAATNAGLDTPFGVAVDASGNLFIADTDNNVIRKVDTNGLITTAAGNGTYGYSGDGGMPTDASLSFPSAVAVDATGNLFIADTGNSVIRKVAPNGLIATVAGNGKLAYSGDGGPATRASLYYPYGVAVDAFGNLLIADTGNSVIRKVDPNGVITTVVGNGTYGYSGDGGAATHASLDYPQGVAVDASGNLYVADTDNNRIREVDTNGLIATVAGSGANGYFGDGGAATNASLYCPQGVAVDTFGNLFIADRCNARIREVALAGNPTLRLNNVTPDNAGNYTVVITSPYGSITSSIVTLTVVSPLVSQPKSLFVTNGSQASFSVSVSGALPLSFQWQKDGTNLSEGGNISGSTTANLILTGVSANDAGNYTVVITSPNAYGSVTSGVAGLAVVLPPEPAHQTVMVGGRTTFDVPVFGTGPFTYQWQLNGTNLPSGMITTVAGIYTNDGYGGYSGDGGAATNASLCDPTGVAMDASGNLFIADTDNDVIRKVDTNGIITTVAGIFDPSGWGGYSGDGGPATNASMFWPNDVAVDASGNLFIADTANVVIRKVDTNGTITTVAGIFDGGSGGYSGDDGAATNASLNWPLGVAVDATGNLFITDSGNNVIRKMDTNGIITTVAGNGTYGYSGDGGAATNASLDWPSGVAMDVSGNLFIADTFNSVIRKVDPNGVITTVAGNGTYGYSGDGGAATNASLNQPSGVAVDIFGNLFIADTYNNVIRKVDPNGIITTAVGNGTNGYSGDGDAATKASLNSPSSVAVDASDNLFIADRGNNRVREVALFASDPTLTLNNVTPNNSGNYTAVITSPYGSVTSSIVTLTVVSSPIISKIIRNTDGSVTLNLLTTPNTNSCVLATTNLATPVVWEPIHTNIAGADGSWQFTDMNVSNYPVRFYRTSTP